MSWLCIAAAAARSCCISSWPPGSTRPSNVLAARVFAAALVRLRSARCPAVALISEPTASAPAGHAAGCRRPRRVSRQRAAGAGVWPATDRRQLLDDTAAEFPLDQVGPGEHSGAAGRPGRLVVGRSSAVGVGLAPRAGSVRAGARRRGRLPVPPAGGPSPARRLPVSPAGAAGACAGLARPRRQASAWCPSASSGPRRAVSSAGLPRPPDRQTAGRPGMQARGATDLVGRRPPPVR